MDGAAGPCSLELIVNGIDGKPAYAAIIKVHIAYGFAGIRRLDLEAGTNSDGKVKFTGLPARVHRPPLNSMLRKMISPAPPLTIPPPNAQQNTTSL